MTSLESIVKLRELRDEAASKMVDNPRWVCARAEEIADEIEREIAEKYMPLPADVNGVLIRIGDTVRELGDCVPMKVMSLTFYEDCVDVNACGMNPKLLLHVKSDKLKERVRKFIHDRRDLNLKDPQEKADRILDEFCADIREMAKEGEL